MRRHRLKAQVVIAALAEKFDVHPNQITQWKTQLLENATNVFATASEKRSAEPDRRSTTGLSRYQRAIFG